MVDFHNWWHNPVRRLGLLRQNFGQNRSYTLKEVRDLMAEAGVGKFEVRRFVQEVDTGTVGGRMVGALIPATRFVVRIRG